MPFKYGKKPPKRMMSVPALSDFLARATEWPAVKPRGWEYGKITLEMLGNDDYGDCGEAAAMHYIQTSTAHTSNPLHGTLQQTLDLYSAVAGFKASDPNSDQGTCLVDLLSYWRDHGIVCTDAKGNTVTHKILGWANLDLSSIAQMRYACDVFGGLYVGMNFPAYLGDNLTNWTWDPAQGSNIAGGHCVNIEGQGGAGVHLQSWGANIAATWELLLNTLDEGYVVVSEAWLTSPGAKSPSGLDVNGLLAAMKAIQAAS